MAATERTLAASDDLTGALLKGAGLDMLEGSISRAKQMQEPLLLAFIDIEGVKAVNELRGRSAGNAVIRGVADALRANLRSYDLIIRYGDDEFICAISGLRMADSGQWLTSVNAAVAEALDHQSMAVGFAELLSDDASDNLVTRAFDALRHASRQLRSKDLARTWNCGDLIVDEVTYSVTRSGSPVRLTSTEFKILIVLAQNCTRIVSKRQLFNQVWGYGADGHLLEVHMSSIRRKLEVHGPRMIHTVRGAGYVLRDPVCR